VLLSFDIETSARQYYAKKKTAKRKAPFHSCPRIRPVCWNNDLLPVICLALSLVKSEREAEFFSFTQSVRSNGAVMGDICLKPKERYFMGIIGLPVRPEKPFVAARWETCFLYMSPLGIIDSDWQESPKE